jgi:hypothetical protein
MKWLWIIGGALVAMGVIVALAGAMLPRGHRATRRARFQQTPEALYALLAGPPGWRTDLKAFGTLPDGKWWERDSHGNQITYELVEDRAPARRVTRIADRSLPFGGTWTYEITAEAGGSALRITEEGEVYNVIFRFMARFVFGYTATMEGVLRDAGRRFGETVRIEG